MRRTITAAAARMKAEHTIAISVGIGREITQHNNMRIIHKRGVEAGLGRWLLLREEMWW